MGLFTKKSAIMPENAMIGNSEDNGDITWTDADYDHAWGMYVVGILENRGTITINGIHYRLYYLPPISTK